MRVAIAGGHGQIALRLARLLSERGDEVRSLIRNPDHADDVRETGAEPVILDLENASDDEVVEAAGEVDAVVFAAGAGPGSGPERKDTMDYGGAVKLLAPRKRYVMVSSMGADPDAGGDDTFAVYLRAKGKADAALRESGLDYTIIRPGRLTNDAGTGRVALSDSGERGEIPRDDVAAVIAAALSAPNTLGKTLDLISGDVPVEEAVKAV
jgi:uncharacterized protein YbjT (DUF2867 family)